MRRIRGDEGGEKERSGRRPGSPATERSSSRSGQWIPSPRPISSQRFRDSSRSRPRSSRALCGRCADQVAVWSLVPVTESSLETYFFVHGLAKRKMAPYCRWFDCPFECASAVNGIRVRDTKADLVLLDENVNDHEFARRTLSDLEGTLKSSTTCRNNLDLYSSKVSRPSAVPQVRVRTNDTNLARLGDGPSWRSKRNKAYRKVCHQP